MVVDNGEYIFITYIHIIQSLGGPLDLPLFASCVGELLLPPLPSHLLGKMVDVQ
jgi:hypothetical protein